MNESNMIEAQRDANAMTVAALMHDEASCKRIAKKYNLENESWAYVYRFLLASIERKSFQKARESMPEYEAAQPGGTAATCACPRDLDGHWHIFMEEKFGGQETPLTTLAKSFFYSGADAVLQALGHVLNDTQYSANKKDERHAAVQKILVDLGTGLRETELQDAVFEVEKVEFEREPDASELH